MASGGSGGRDRARKRSDGASDRHGVVGSGERPGSKGRFDDDDRSRERRNDPIAGKEAMLVRARPGRSLGADCPAAPQNLKVQVRVGGRIVPVDAAGGNGDGVSVGGERAPVRGDVDAERPSRNDVDARIGKLVRDVGRDFHAVRRGIPGSDDGRARPGEHFAVASEPQAERPGVAQIVEGGGPQRIAGHDEAHGAVRFDDVRAEGGKPRLPSGLGLRQAASCDADVSCFGASVGHPFEGPCIAHLADERHSVRVLPLRDSRPSHRGRPLLDAVRPAISARLVCSVRTLPLAAATLSVAAGDSVTAGLPVPLSFSAGVSAFHGSRSFLSW